MHNRNRNVGIVGVGQTAHSGHREDVNQPELINEAVQAALQDAGLGMEDVGCVVHGNMELFEMVHQPDCWHTLGSGAFGKEALRVTTGGTTGATLACAADNLVASGLHDVVLAIGFEKLQEGNTTGGITNMADPLWGRKLQTGALSGAAAQEMIAEFGRERARAAATIYRILMDQHAMRNEYAHRRLGLELDQAAELAQSSPALVGDLRLLDMCPQSDGACAVVFASEQRVRQRQLCAAWIRDHITVHREETFTLFADEPIETTQRYAARKLFGRNGIVDPRREIDVFEMYDPSSWWGVQWLRDFLLLTGDEHLRMVENHEIALDGPFPVNPSGGVIASNPIGATALVRIAEAANQVRGRAGSHQVAKSVRQALASGFGGTFWSVLMLLTKEIPGAEDGGRSIVSAATSPMSSAAQRAVAAAPRPAQAQGSAPQRAEGLVMRKQLLSIGQHFTTGPLMGKFLKELRDHRRITGNRCPSCGRIQTPPREVCAVCRVRVDELVEIGPEGEVVSYDITYYASPDPLTGESRETPYCSAFFVLDGCGRQDVFWHEVNPAHIDRLRKGARVRPVWAEERTGAITDIQYFDVIA